MIPRIIHYCWFGKGPIPSSHKNYMESWKKLMPGYEIKRWDEKTFDIQCNAYVQKAYQQKKYAFVSDYVRLKALFDEGGFYLDTDVELFKSLDGYRNHRFISGIAYFEEFENYKHLLNEDLLPKDPNTLIPCLGIMSAAMGSQPNNELIHDILHFYDNLQPDNQYMNGVVLDQIMANEAIKYGFTFNDKEQMLTHNQILLPSYKFSSAQNQLTSESLLFHHCAQSWQSKTKTQQLHTFLDKYHLLQLYKKITGQKRKLIYFIQNR